MSTTTLTANTDLVAERQEYGDDPLSVRETGQYRQEYVKVSAEPEHLDEGLARFCHSFPDGAQYRMNMFPLRKNYLRGLLKDAGFQAIHTYGDFQETYQEEDPDFFIHVAEKAYVDG